MDDKKFVDDENSILLNMAIINIDYENYLLKMKKDIEKLNERIDKLDNNFFLEDFNYNIFFKKKMYNVNNIQLIIDDLSFFNEYIIYKIKHKCNHEWIDDEIDISLDYSKKITYCKNCEISKK